MLRAVLTSAVKEGVRTAGEASRPRAVLRPRLPVSQPPTPRTKGPSDERAHAL